MLHERIKIWEGGYKGNIKGNAVLDTYILHNSEQFNSNKIRPAVLICPGGGYEFISDREKEPIAVRFLSEGYNVFTLTYDIAPHARHPQPILDVSRAMWIIRENAEKWYVDTDKIAVCGFSAGGHLAASLGVLWQEEYISCLSGMPAGINKPNAMILCYPVISSGSFAHRGSFIRLLGEDATQEELDMLSLEKRVTENTPPAFIWHTFEDATVPVENSICFAAALREKNIPFEMHIFNLGVHGLALCDEETGGTIPELINAHAAKWFGLCAEWLKDLFR